jgi:hypothetical protein
MEFNSGGKSRPTIAAIIECEGIEHLIHFLAKGVEFAERCPTDDSHNLVSQITQLLSGMLRRIFDIS